MKRRYTKVIIKKLLERYQGNAAVQPCNGRAIVGQVRGRVLIGL